jgi:hypothetical protein
MSSIVLLGRHSFFFCARRRWLSKRTIKARGQRNSKQIRSASTNFNYPWNPKELVSGESRAHISMASAAGNAPKTKSAYWSSAHAMDTCKAVDKEQEERKWKDWAELLQKRTSCISTSNCLLSNPDLWITNRTDRRISVHFWMKCELRHQGVACVGDEA